MQHKVLTSAPHHRPLLAGRDDQGRGLFVVVLCAAWCHTCTEFRDGIASIAGAHPDATFVWLDIEDDCAICGDIEVENFPTVVAFRGDQVLHYGITVPSPAVTARLVDELATREGGLADVPDAVRALRNALLQPAQGEQ